MRMKFVKLYGEPEYWRLDEERMRLYNYQNGSFAIDENSDEWMLSTIVEAEDWRDLYLKTGYCVLYAHGFPRETWIDPDGICYEGRYCSHEVLAKEIGKIVFGEDDMNGDDLFNKFGWIKVTTSLMLQHYFDEGHYDCITVAQAETLRKWAEAWNVHIFDNVEWA